MDLFGCARQGALFGHAPEIEQMLEVELVDVHRSFL
jgi:hypothetical protein